ncbi:shikimate kinase [Mesobacillus subterraneus]|uniref:Shikimate kinase n=1 Tax=Mesobacillus subterraneus TaxID=285983 RepID=A0A427TT11_9BACI|nr:shikimate kinase [Mesobacillus subterraneus]RSD27421.1 shikimate kinase [Mesobacillus subterraneus]
MEAIYLIGFMGSGKSTVSQELGKRLSVPVYDTDEEVVKTRGKAINEIFAMDGEEAFRIIESEVLQSMPDKDAVVATGGGIIMADANRKCLRDKGTVVFLYAGLDEILQRLEGDDTRPLLRQEKRKAAESLYNSRLLLYRDISDLEIDTTGKSIGAITEEILHRMK